MTATSIEVLDNSCEGQRFIKLYYFVVDLLRQASSVKAKAKKAMIKLGFSGSKTVVYVGNKHGYIA